MNHVYVRFRTHGLCHSIIRYDFVDGDTLDTCHAELDARLLPMGFKRMPYGYRRGEHMVIVR